MSSPDDAADGVAGARAGGSDAVNTATKKSNSKPGPFERLVTFLRQVVAELRKVIWPTRSELINYTVVVLIFVVIMAAILAVYDFFFARFVFWIF
ncbi:preprotein translocase subunit SecE, partial [Arthrospira platensis SPKY1]|nr:preprotein translocase subunit SecE [Arthrospira platensis SPKY1]